MTPFRRNLTYLVAAIAPIALTVLVACSGKTTQGGGLEVIIATNLRNSDIDEVSLDVDQQASPGDGGQWNHLIGPLTQSLTSTAALPARFALRAGTSPDQLVRIQVVGLKGGQAVDLREAEVQVPTTYVAELTMLLAQSCLGQVQIVGGQVQPVCAALGESCQPITGACGPTLISGTLPAYGGGMQADASVGAFFVDAGADAKQDATRGDARADSTVPRESGGGVDTGPAESGPPDTGADASCVDPAGCPPGQACDVATGTCTTTCSSSQPCNGGCCNSGVCAPGTTDQTACGTSALVACVSCVGSNSGTACLHGTCGCAVKADCPGDQACDVTTGLCGTACSVDEPCNTGCCNSGVCAAGNTQPICGAPGSTCGSCLGSASGAACVTGRCGCNAATDCAVGQACDAMTNACTTACSSTQACNGGCCSAATAGTCVAGTSDIACATDVVCSDCAATAKSCCSGVCVDEQTDNGNCGGCGLACSTGCGVGECVVTLASTPGGIFGIAADSTNVYWVDNAGRVMQVANAVGSTAITLASGQSSPRSIAVDATNVYWTNTGAGTVLQMPIGGGATTTIAPSQNMPFAIAVEGTFVYWVNNPTTGSGAAVRAPVGGGVPTTLGAAPDGSYGIAVDSKNVYWTSGAPSDTVWECSIGGCGMAPIPLAITGGSSLGGIASDGTNVHWLSEYVTATSYCGNCGALYACSVNGCVNQMAPKVVAGGLNEPVPVATDGTSVYWTDYGGGTVAKCAGTGLGTCTPTTLASGLGNPYAIAVDKTSVYAGEFAIVKITPK